MENIENKLKEKNNIRMSESENNRVFSNILKFIENYEPMLEHDIYRENQKSPYMPHLFRVTGVVFASFIIFFIGGGLSYEASTSLPGDFLYSLKINTIEEVRGAFIKSPEEKLLYNQSRVAKRIDEVIALAEKGNLTIEKSIEVEKALDSHISEIEAVAKELKEKDPAIFETTTQTLTPIMEQHKNELKEVNEKSTIKETEKIESIISGTEINQKTDINIEKKDNSIKTLTSEDLTIQNTENAKKEESILKIEESKKAVDSIIAKIEKETDSIKAITQKEPIEDIKTTQ